MSLSLFLKLLSLPCLLFFDSMQDGRYDNKQSDDEVPVMMELWGMQSTPSLPSLPGPVWPGMEAPDRILSMGQIELNCVFMLN